jgi:hypothetical protein
MRGKTQAALERLEQAVESGWRPYWWLFMKYDPALEPLRREAAFQQLIRRLESEGLG